MNKVFCRAKELQTEPCSAADAADVIQGFLDRVGAALCQLVSFKRWKTKNKNDEQELRAGTWSPA